MEDLWTYLPAPALFKIFSHLKCNELLQCGTVCKAWYEMSRDDFLWKQLFYLNYRVDSNVSIVPGRSWYNEFKRLCYNIPIVQTEVLTEHYHQVLHVSFSHNGNYFATCSKDGSVLVWNSDYPASIKYQRDMTTFSWKYTQYSQFNESDTLLLVSGVHFGTPHSTSGEIAVFSLQGNFDLQCRVVNKPYDIFGTWYSDQHLLSGDLQWLAHLVSTSVLWLNKASQEADSEHVPITQSMYRFYNRNASSVRAVMVANCLPNSECVDGDEEDGYMHYNDGRTKGQEEASQGERGNPPSHRDLDRGAASGSALGAAGGSYKAHDLNLRRPTDISMQYASTICYSADYRRVENESRCGYGGGHGGSVGGPYDRIDDDDAVEDDVDDDVDVEAELLSEVDDEEVDPFDYENGIPWHKYTRSENGDGSSPAVSYDDSAYDDVDQVVHNDKYLIFTTGYKTYTPHQIGFKRIKPFMFPKRIDPGLSLKERLELHERKKELLKSNLQPPEPDWLNYDSVADKFDKIDHLIDLHGHIIGMGLSPDHRYLYVNSRPWPQGYEITHPLDPPPIAQEIDIHVIDLVTLKEVGTMLRAHKAYTPNNECFFIFLDVCDQYVASGAEDKHGYLWDRHYGICLAMFPHADVVSSVAFNPNDSEMLVTTSDDNTIKVWRSRAKVAEFGLKQSDFPKGIEVQKIKKTMVSNFINGYDTNKNDAYRFDIVDYCVFGAMLLLSACTGIYYAVRARFSKKMGTTVRDYLTGSGHMKPFPVAMSLIASYVSGVTVLGSPTEIYNYGSQYWAICIAIVTSGITIMFVYLPVFFKLQVYSSYEYLEIRFDRKVRMLASIFFIIDEILFLPILIYVPSLAFNQVTGVDIYIIGTVVCIICIFYTVLGGLEAVLWTDTWQIIVMFISVVVVVVLGTISYGGIDTVFDVSNQFGRIDFFNFDPSMYTRNTIYSVVFGGYVYWLSFNSVNQTMVQRYMSLPNLMKSKLAIIIFIVGVVMFISICCYAGLLIFATYSTCDPLTSGRIIADDQLLPLFVMETVGHLRGVPGLFVAGVFGAALSSLSVILNSTSLVILEDLIKPYVKKQLADRHEKWIVKSVALILGTISIGFLYIVQYLGSVLEVATALSAIAAGTTFGVFSLGMVIPWSNTKGAVVGAIAGGVMSGLVSFGRRFVQAMGQVSDQKLPISVDGCDLTYGIDIFTNSSIIRESPSDAADVFPLFRLSYHWITPIGVSTVLIVGTLVSFLTKPTDLSTLDPDLISPLSAWLLPPEAQRYAGTAIKKARNTREHEVDVVLMNDVIINGDIGTKVHDSLGPTELLLVGVGKGDGALDLC